jgi:hypothetical protein
LSDDSNKSRLKQEIDRLKDENDALKVFILTIFFFDEYLI